METDDTTGIQTFVRGDDEVYEDCVRKGGYVLVERRPGEFMLHESACGHLELTPGRWTLTNRPRRWHRQSRVLDEWAASQTGIKPRRCSTCM
jgi:hypothetical protein